MGTILTLLERDAAFDTVELYQKLLTGDTFGKDRHFQKAYIPLNARSGLENQDCTINEDGIPAFKKAAYSSSCDSSIINRSCNPLFSAYCSKYFKSNK